MGKPGSLGAVAAATRIALQNRTADAYTWDEMDFQDKLKEVRSRLTDVMSLFDRLEAEVETRAIRPSYTVMMAGRKRTTTSCDVSGMSNDCREGHPPHALLEGSNHDVLAMYEQEDNDPNTLYKNFRCIGKDFVTGSPLAIAVLRGKTDIVHSLIEAKAHPDSEYSFIAGAEQVTWTGSAVHAAVPSGNLDVLKELVSLGADINAQGSNGANLIWQAAYFGQAHILEYLLEQGVMADIPASSQDNSKLRYTPLHAAAIAGHTRIVQTLLAARARHTLEWECRQPLEDAIKHCHADVVKQLIVASSDIFAAVHTEPRDLLRRTSKDNFAAVERVIHSVFDSEKQDKPTVVKRCIDAVFESENPVLLSQVAQGLIHSSKTLERMSKADFVRFLSAPGNAPVHMLGAIFQPYTLRFWDEVDGKRCRKQRTAAYVGREDAVNIVEGPHHRVILTAFNRKRLLPGYGKEFIESLLPQEGERARTMYVPATSYMCHIPTLHKDLQVLLAIADCKNSQIFRNQGCQAIINLKWRVERKLARFRMFLALLEVLVLFVINHSMNSEVHTLARGSTCSGVTTVLCQASIASVAIWFLALVIEVAQMIGYISSGLTRRYFFTPRYWFDLLVLIATGVINICLLTLDRRSTDTVEFRTSFGVVIFLKWMRFLTFLRQLRRVGLNILPITTTMWEVVPFGLVLSVYLTGAVNMYYALGINNSLFDSFVLVYRLVVLGDLDMAEFESVPNPLLFVHKNGTISQTQNTNPHYNEVVRIFIVFVSFVIGLTMMNLFVAILCLSYSQAAENAWYSFMRSRANIVLDQHAVRLGGKTILCRRRQRRGPEGAFGDPEVLNGATLDDELQEARSAYIWFALQADSKLL